MNLINVLKLLLGKYISKNEKNFDLVLTNKRTIKDFELYIRINFKTKSTIKNILETLNLPKELGFFINEKLKKSKKLNNLKYYTLNFFNININKNKNFFF